MSTGDAQINREPDTGGPYCGWCAAGRSIFYGCCGRANPHHHTQTVVAGTAEGSYRSIASDDCPRAKGALKP